MIYNSSWSRWSDPAKWRALVTDVDKDDPLAKACRRLAKELPVYNNPIETMQKLKDSDFTKYDPRAIAGKAGFYTDTRILLKLTPDESRRAANFWGHVTGRVPQVSSVLDLHGSDRDATILSLAVEVSEEPMLVAEVGIPEASVLINAAYVVAMCSRHPTGSLRFRNTSKEGPIKMVENGAPVCCAMPFSSSANHEDEDAREKELNRRSAMMTIWRRSTDLVRA